MKNLPIIAMARDEAGRWSSMPYISAFFSDDDALMTLGTTGTSSLVVAMAWRFCSSRRAARRRGIEAVGDTVLLADGCRLEPMYGSILDSLVVQGGFETLRFTA